jgi:hypothetical protein
VLEPEESKDQVVGMLERTRETMGNSTRIGNKKWKAEAFRYIDNVGTGQCFCPYDLYVFSGLRILIPLLGFIPKRA